jgi:predicted nucleotidyltransferase
MDLIKRFTEQNTLSRAKQLTLTDVKFPNGFANFMESLIAAGLISEYSRTSLDGRYRWVDTRKTGGVLLETTEHPLLTGQYAGDVTVVGVNEAIQIFEMVAKTNGVTHSTSKKTAPRVTHEYHDTLTPALWDKQGEEYVLKRDVKETLQSIADEFIAFQKMADLEVQDITLTGSCANFHWTDQSDIDLHVTFDPKRTVRQYGPLVPEYFEAKRKVWSELHDISIRGFAVEPYMQSIAEKHHATAIYSIRDDRWTMAPTHDAPTIDSSAVKTKLQQLMNDIDSVVTTCNKAQPVEALMTKIKKMRTAGLESGGEFSTENLVFKELRRNGYFEKLADCKTNIFDRDLSIEDEEWDLLRNPD